MNPPPRAAAVRGRAPRGTAARLAWAAVVILVFAGFMALGTWQLHRLTWKLKLIHDVATRVHAPPVAAPGPATWPRIEAGDQQYLHVQLGGRFLGHDQTLVRGTSELGYGYWVMTPLRTGRGFIVLVNRGWIPDTLPGTPPFMQVAPPAGEVTLTGLLRFSEPGGGVLRPNQPDRGLWYSRDVAAIAAAHQLQGQQVAPYFIDADARAARWPAGGLTVIRFPNHHLGYAITWYLLALGTLLGAGLVARQEWRSRGGG